MIRAFGEAYIIIFYIVLHISLFACDDRCIIPVKALTVSLPPTYHVQAASIIKLTNLQPKYLMMLGQLLLLGDLLTVGMWIGSRVLSLVRKFFLTIVCIFTTVIFLKVIGAI